MSSTADRVVVTGGAGFLGSHLVDGLLADGAPRVLVLDNFSSGARGNLARHQNDPRLEVVEADVRDRAAVTTTLRHARIVYHLAAWVPRAAVADDLDEAFTTNVLGTCNVLRAAADWGAEKVVFASSREVYGTPIELPVDEGQPLMALTSFGASKISGEAYCRAFRHTRDLACAVLRFGDIYGPRATGTHIAEWLAHLAAGRPVVLAGERDVLDFVWVGQAVEALTRAAAVAGPLPPINVASGTGVGLGVVARRLARLSGGPSRVRVGPAPISPPTRFIANVDRMRRLLGIEPPQDPLFQLASLVARPPDEPVVPARTALSIAV